MLTSDQFFQSLRSALNHLYDPYFLRKSPLVKVFQLGDQPDTYVALQHILNEAIAAYEPRPNEPQLLQRRKKYELIMYRYVQQFSQEEVADQLGLSVRHLRREQNAAIYDLAAYLWEKYTLGNRPFQVLDLETDESQGTPEDGSTEAKAVEKEILADVDAAKLLTASGLEWLKELPLEQPTDLKAVLTAVLDLSQPLAEQHGVVFRVSVPDGLPGLSIQQVALRQLLLNILSVAVGSPAGGQLQINGKAQTAAVELVIACQSSGIRSAAEERSLSADEQSNLSIAGQIAGLFGGTLSISKESAPLSVTLVLPAIRKRQILVIDDNIDFIQLMERTLSGPHYTVTGERDPARCLARVEQTRPDIIVLDVMMPQIDGWEVLGRLRRHPDMAHIPVIICTILPQEELARSLGASDFMRKPITPERILAVLERQSKLLG